MSAVEWARLLVHCGAIELRLDPDEWFTWASGRRAPIYCDNRLLMAHPVARARIADGLAQAVRQGFPDVEVIAGTATAGIPHAAWVAERLELPMAYVRGAAKGHGRQKRVEGGGVGGERVVLIEDTISTGGSSGSSVEGVRAEGGKVVGVQAIFTYRFPLAERRLSELGVPCQALTDYDTLLEALDLDGETARALRRWRTEFSAGS